MDDECPDLVPAKVPVTILTGFLGSGKTTLLQRVLTEKHNLRIAVVVNEFEFGKTIEKGLTLQSTQKADDEWVELDNGCMCCSAQSQAVKALEKLMEKKGLFDLVLIETSGLADPGPVAAMFWQDEALCASLYLCGIVAVVDARNVLSHFATDAVNEVARQLLCADTIVINKEDLVTAEGMQEVKHAVGKLNPLANIVTSSYGKVDNLESLLFIHTTNRMEDGCRYESGLQVPHLHSTITSFSVDIQASDLADPQKMLPVFSSRLDVDNLCKDLLYHADRETFSIVRLKAAIWVLGAETPAAPSSLHQLQVICDLFDVQPMVGELIRRDRCRFLILGRNLDPARIKQIIVSHMHRCIVLSPQ